MTDSEMFGKLFKLLSPIVLITTMGLTGFLMLDLLDEFTTNNPELLEPKISKIESVSKEIDVPQFNIVEEFSWDPNYYLYSTDEYNLKVTFNDENEIKSLVKEKK